MIQLDIIELIEAVDSINEDIANRYGEDGNALYTVYAYWSYVKIEICRSKHRVSIAEVTIWDSEEDDREWIERQEHTPEMLKLLEQSAVPVLDHIPAHYEPMEPYLRRKINHIIEQISKIRL